MSSLQTFEATLKEVVEAKRLSASKMTKLTEIAMKFMENDTQLVSILYRTHKSLPTAAKVNSLYVFDALSRAARSYASKHNLTGDVNSKKGSCFTFLLKVEGVLDGLFQDMVSSGSPESKEKCKKVLDIWVKANTFSTTVLSRLGELVKGGEREPTENTSITTVDPRTQTTAATITPPASTPPLTIDPVQSTLLALLTQAATTSATPVPGQTPPNIASSSTPQLDNAQLLLLQQLAQTAKLNAPSAVPHVASIPSQVPSLNPPNGGFGANGNGPALNRDERYNLASGGYSRDAYAIQGERLSRGGYRGGYRGRERGRGRWDNRDDFRGGNRDSYQDRERDFDLSPNSRPGRSRSRSPRGRYASRRDVKPYSPPRRPSLNTEFSNLGSGTVARGESEKDEFGRDIRPPSPMKTDAVTTPTKADEHHITTAAVEPVPELPSNQIDVPTVVAPTIPSQIAVVSTASSNEVSQQGLEKFVLATFDFTAPTAWEALGKMWQVTCGYPPAQEELMQFVMSGGMIPVASVASRPLQSAIEVWSEDNYTVRQGGDGSGRGGRGRGGFRTGRGGGGGGYNSTDRNIQEKWGYSTHNEESDAIVLGGGINEDQDGSDDMQITPKKSPQQTPSTDDGGVAGCPGRMQRVGDRWVFVRDS